MKNVRTLEKPIQIRSAKSGTFLIPREMEDLTVEAIVSEQKSLDTINNVLLVPNLKFNLLSVRKLEMFGLKIVFRNGKGNIQNKNKMIAVAHREEKLYKTAFSAPNVECAAVITTIREIPELWHQRFGHISRTGPEKVKHLVEWNLDKSRSKSSICSVCVERKQTRLAHLQSRTRATRPLQLVHSDLKGPIQNKAYNGKRYVLTFIGDYSSSS